MKGQILCGSTDVRSLEPRVRKWNGGCQGLARGENGEFLFNGGRASVWEDEKVSGDGQWCRLHNDMNVPNATQRTSYSYDGKFHVTCTSPQFLDIEIQILKTRCKEVSTG